MRNKNEKLNRLLIQFIRDGHLSLAKKVSDILMQIYGHEGMVHCRDLADTAHCRVFYIDFTRFKTFSWEYIAYRKLFNPFKHIEFLLVFTLEMLVYSFQRSMVLLSQKMKRKIDQLEEDDKRVAYFILNGLWHFVAGFIILASFALSLSVNLITGVARRFLAPVRYTIRPAIEMADHYPHFSLLLIIITLNLTMMALTGGLPLLLLGSQWMAYGVLSKVAIVGLATTTLHSFLIKGFNTLRDIADAWKKVNIKLKPDDIANARRERDSQDQQVINTMKVDEEPTVEKLNEYLKSLKGPEKHFPLIVLLPRKRKMWLYDSTNLRELDFFNEAVLGKIQYAHELNTPYVLYKSCDRLFRERNYPKTQGIFRQLVEADVYDFKTGSTAKMTELLHRLPVDKVEVRLPGDEDFFHQTAQFFGAERVYDFIFRRMGVLYIPPSRSSGHLPPEGAGPRIKVC